MRLMIVLAVVVLPLQALQFLPDSHTNANRPAARKAKKWNCEEAN